MPVLALLFAAQGLYRVFRSVKPTKTTTYHKLGDV